MHIIKLRMMHIQYVTTYTLRTSLLSSAVSEQFNNGLSAAI